jgi:hypothetical protein
MDDRRSQNLAAAIISLAALTPVAGFFYFRASINVCGPWLIFNFGMPWPDLLPGAVQFLCFAIVLGFLVASIAGIRYGGQARTAGIIVLPISIVADPVLVFFVFFVSVFGDPGEGGWC